MTATPQKYTFDADFFEVVGGNKPATQAAAVKPRTAEAQRQEAYDQGYTAGVAEGQQQAQADLARLQQHLQATLAQLQTTVEQREAELVRQVVGLMSASLGALVGQVATRFGAEVLDHHLRALLALVKTDEQLTLRVHPAAQGYHDKLALPQANILGLPLRIVPDGSLGPVDAALEWRSGGAEARLEGHLQAVRQLIQAAGAKSVPVPEIADTAPQDTAAAPPPAAPQAAAQATPAEDPVQTAQDAAAKERAARAAALLGDDDLVDALK